MSALRSRYFIDTTSLFFPTIGTPMNPNPSPDPSGSPAGLSASVHPAPLLERATDGAGALARRGIDAVRDSSQRLRDEAWRFSDDTVRRVRTEPVKSLLIAAAAGAALMALVGLLTRSRAAD
jgi:hypothetical protein